MFLSESTSPRLTSTGTGSPESVVTADPGAVYVQTDASPTWTGIWYKGSGTGNTGWVQVTDADLVAIAGLTSAANKLPYFTGAGAAALADFTAAGRALVDDADASAQRTTLGLAIGTNVQAYDAELAALAGLTSAADKGIQFTGSGTAATFDLTAAGKALLDDAAASNQRTTLGLGTVATLDSDTDGTLAANSDSKVATQKATKTYVDATVASGTVSDGDKGDIVVSSSGTVWSFDTGVVTAFAKTMLDDAAASNVRTTLGLGSAATISSTAGGDLAGTLPSPTVAKITETSGPTTLTLGTIADGEYLKRVGTTLVSGAPSGSGAPSNVDYLVKTADGGLSAERVVTDTTSITVDWGTAGQAKIQREALTGDVTASQNSNATTIANDAVTYAKMQNISASQRVLGRNTAGSGDTEELALSTVLGMTGVGQEVVLYTTGDGTGITTIADWPTLQLSVAANETWDVEWLILGTVSNASGALFQWTADGGAAAPIWFFTNTSAAASLNAQTRAEVTNTNAVWTVTGATLGLFVRGVYFNGAGSTTLKLRCTGGASSTVTPKKGSMMRARRLA